MVYVQSLKKFLIIFKSKIEIEKIIKNYKILQIHRRIK